MGEGTTHRFWSLEKGSCTCPPNQREEESAPRSVCWHAELFVRGSGCVRAGTGDQDKVGEHQESARVGEDTGRILEMRATPWSPDGSDNAFDIQVGMERLVEMVPRDPGEVLIENKVARTYLRRADIEQRGFSEGCPGCWYLRTGQGRQQAHSEACLEIIEGLLMGDSAGSTRLAAAEDRIDRALADAVERHAAQDLGVRGMLGKASAACHPVSESQKKIALETERDSTPRPSVSYGGSSASGARPSITTRTVQDTDTSDRPHVPEGESVKQVTHRRALWTTHATSLFLSGHIVATDCTSSVLR